MRDDPTPKERDMRKLLTAAAVLGTSLALAACDTAEEAEPAAEDTTMAEEPAPEPAPTPTGTPTPEPTDTPTPEPAEDGSDEY
jgi:hypothetical protein